MSQVSAQDSQRSPAARSAVARQARPTSGRTPSLLVSVRNVHEARAALAGGCDLLDVKEPNRGPLGMADPDVIAAVAQFAAADRKASAGACSAALGELVDWRSKTSEFLLPPGVGYVKFGSAYLDTPNSWIDAWQHALSRLAAPARPDLQCVAVAYADWRRANSLAPTRLLEAAHAVACPVLLIDTFDKSAGSLLELMELSELRKLCDATHRAGMKIALAGRLDCVQFPALAEARPDILGVRGAACIGGRRSAAVSAEAVRTLKQTLRAAFSCDAID